MRTVQLCGQEAGSARWRYALVAEDLEADGVHWESYGILVRDQDTGEETAVRHITVNASDARELLDTVSRLSVSPVTLQDVVEDYLGRL